MPERGRGTRGTRGDGGSRAAGSGGVGRFGALRSTLRRHPLATDTALTVAILIATAPLLLLSWPLRTITPLEMETDLGFQIGLLAPLVWRRRNPTAVFVTIYAVALLHLVCSPNRLLPGHLALLIAFYTVAAQTSGRRTLVAAAMMGMGTLMGEVSFDTTENRETNWLLVCGLVITAWILGTSMRTRTAYLAVLEDRTIRLERDRDQRARLAVATERARIAREMHDVVAHHISVMIALAQGAQYTVRTSPDQAEEVMGRVSDTGRQALDQMRRLLGVLRDPDGHPARAPQPGVADLDTLLATVQAAGLTTELVVDGTPFPLSSDGQLVVYRLVQESLTNTIKHADATTAWVRLRYGPDRELEIEVVDNGCGAIKRPDLLGGHGLAGMVERAALFGGTVDAGEDPGGGWRVHAHFRVPETEESTELNA